MSTTTNYPSATPQSQPPKKDYKNLVIGLLAAGFLGTWGYLLWNNNKQEQVQQSQQTQIAKVTDEKGALQKNFDDALVRLDSLTGTNNRLQTQLSGANSDISKKKAEIRSILGKKNATVAELNKAKALIADLNTKISDLQAQVATLTTQNTQLTADKTQLTADKEKLTSDLSTTTTQKEDLEKKVDKLIISFDVNNRIAQNGQTDVYVCITGPDGKPISVPALGSGTFASRDEGDKIYTAKVPVDIEAGKTKSVQFAWKQSGSFVPGSYKIEIYHNGFKIGEDTKELKKGGLFS